MYNTAAIHALHKLSQGSDELSKAVRIRIIPIQNDIAVPHFLRVASCILYDPMPALKLHSFTPFICYLDFVTKVVLPAFWGALIWYVETMPERSKGEHCIQKMRQCVMDQYIIEQYLLLLRIIPPYLNTNTSCDCVTPTFSASLI